MSTESTTESTNDQRSRRLYLGGIHANTTESDINGLLSAMCTVDSVDIVRKRDAEQIDDVRCAFATVSGSLDDINECKRRYNGTKWRGGILRVEDASVHYLERMEREKEEMRNPPPVQPKKKPKITVDNPNVMKIRAKDKIKLFRVNINRRPPGVRSFAHTPEKRLDELWKPCESVDRYKEPTKNESDMFIADEGEHDVLMDMDPVMMDAERSLAIRVAQKVIEKEKARDVVHDEEDEPKPHPFAAMFSGDQPFTMSGTITEEKQEEKEEEKEEEEAEFEPHGATHKRSSLFSTSAAPTTFFRPTNHTPVQPDEQRAVAARLKAIHKSAKKRRK